MDDSTWENVQNVNNQECWQAGRPHTNRGGVGGVVVVVVGVAAGILLSQSLGVRPSLTVHSLHCLELFFSQIKTSLNSTFTIKSEKLRVKKEKKEIKAAIV